MRMVGNDIYLQRGETFSLDFDVLNEYGDPFMIFKEWPNPYLAITVTAARYEQEDDVRTTYWLDLKNRYVEAADGSLTVIPLKTFISTEALYLPLFSINDAMVLYGKDFGGQIVLDSESDFDITNYLFYVDLLQDGNKTYKYLSSYEIDDNGDITDEVWEDYNFRVIKQFTTKDWVEQKYLFDIKVLAGESLDEYLYNYLFQEGYDNLPALPWDETTSDEQIERIEDKETREYLLEIYESGAPLMPDFDTKLLVLEPTNIFVSANIQGGVR